MKRTSRQMNAFISCRSKRALINTDFFAVPIWTKLFIHFSKNATFKNVFDIRPTLKSVIRTYMLLIYINFYLSSVSYLQHCIECIFFAVTHLLVPFSVCVCVCGCTTRQPRSLAIVVITIIYIVHEFLYYIFLFSLSPHSQSDDYMRDVHCAGNLFKKNAPHQPSGGLC